MSIRRWRRTPTSQMRDTHHACPTPSIRSASRSVRLPTGPRRRAPGQRNLTNSNGDYDEMADAHKAQHDYHLVDPSPWPIVGSISAFVLAVGAITWMHKSFAAAPLIFAAGALGVLYTMVELVARRDERGRASRRSHPRGAAQSPLRHDPVHRLGSDVLRRLVLGLFQHRAVSRRRASDRARANSSAMSGRPRASRPSIPGICRCSTR